MAIKVSGTVVVDNDRNANAGVVTATSLSINPIPITFSPTDASSDVSITSNIVITYNASIAKGSGNITLREGDPSTGDVIETIAVSSGSVTLSAAQVTINPSDLPTGKDIYVVIDEGAFVQSNTELGGSSPLLNTYNFTTGPITTSSFSPSDGATDVAVESNIVITFSENITKETTAATKYITLRAGNPSTGTIRQTIDVSTSAVTVSGNQATINPPSDLENDEDTYVVVDAGCFRNADGDVASGNAIINTYNFTTETGIVIPPLGQCNSTIGGYLLCKSSGNLWVLAPYSAEVRRVWADRNQANTMAQICTSCTGWFVPSQNQLNNPGYQCRTYWDCVISTGHWSDTTVTGHPNYAYRINVAFGNNTPYNKNNDNLVRSFRCVSY